MAASNKKKLLNWKGGGKEKNEILIRKRNEKLGFARIRR